MHRSNSFRKSNKITMTGRKVLHFTRKANQNPHCAICKTELHGISLSPSGGKSRRTNSRLFGGVLCANCTAEIVKLGSRVEQGDMKLSDIGMKQRAYVLQLQPH